MAKRYKKPAPKWPWRDHLTADEAKVLAKAEAAKKRWQELNRERATITSRAIQRAKYAAGVRR